MSDRTTARLRLTALPIPDGAFRPVRGEQQGEEPITATDEGHDSPEGADQAHRRGYVEGHADAMAAAAAERERLLALLASADALRPEPSEELAQLIAETVERLVVQIVGEVGIDAAALQRRATAAAAMIADGDNARTLRLHPDDCALLADMRLGLTLMPDPGVLPGSIRIDCSAGWIEHGTALYLDALRQELGLKGRDE